MENYEELSSAFTIMIKRIKIMKIRLKILGEKINIILSECEIKYEQFQNLQIEFDGISMGLEYLKSETKRTIIMLKICLYKQRIKDMPNQTTIIKKQTPGNSTNIQQSKYEFRNAIHTIWTNNFGNLVSTKCNTKEDGILVKFTNYLILTIFRKFSGKKKTNRMGIG